MSHCGTRVAATKEGCCASSYSQSVSSCPTPSCQPSDYHVLQISPCECPDGKHQKSDDEEPSVGNHCAIWHCSKAERGDIDCIQQWWLHEVGCQAPQRLDW